MSCWACLGLAALIRLGDLVRLLLGDLAGRFEEDLEVDVLPSATFVVDQSAESSEDDDGDQLPMSSFSWRLMGSLDR